MAKRRRWWLIPVTVLCVLILIIVIASWVADEPVRRYVEAEANSLVPGYHVTIGRLALHPLTLSVDLREVTVRQDIHPDPPVLSISEVTADAKLAPLFSGQLGAEVRIQTPRFAINKKHVDGFLRRRDKEVVKEHTEVWQDKIREGNAFRGAFYVSNGQMTYDEGNTVSEPLRIEGIDVEVDNITNRPDAADEYPSPVRVRAVFPDQSRMDVQGRVNLLAIPVPRVEADLKIDRLPLKNLLPVAGRFNLQCREGALDLNGRLQYSKESTVLTIDDLRLQDAKIDYVHSAVTKPKEVRRAKQVAEKAKEVHQDSTVRIKVERGKIVHSEVGFVNKATDPDYRVFIADLDMDLNNLSNRLEEGTGIVKMTGKFMGTGRTEVNGSFRPEKPSPDFDVNVKIVKTQVEAFNNVLRAYGDMDTHRGMFAFFSELTVKDNEIHGYVKPLLKDVEVYDPEQDKEKPVTKKMYEAVVGSVLELLENKPRHEAATVTDLSGPVQNPHANTWEVVEKLVQNAFFKAILPGFERVG
ncbi:MAG TPA: DUF748 domain-containing protein [Nitrospira sp.]|nr:DUF748 domain-containing protein [Nitrospira sp.]